VRRLLLLLWLEILFFIVVLDAPVVDFRVNHSGRIQVFVIILFVVIDPVVVHLIITHIMLGSPWRTMVLMRTGPVLKVILGIFARVGLLESWWHVVLVLERLVSSIVGVVSPVRRFAVVVISAGIVSGAAVGSSAVIVTPSAIVVGWAGNATSVLGAVTSSIVSVG